MAIIRVRPGVVKSSPGAYPELRGGISGEMDVAQTHGILYEPTYQGTVFSDGVTSTALTANTIGLTSSGTPILGVWNPANSPVNLAILRAHLQLLLPASAASMGLLIWASSLGNGAISTGKAAFNRKTLSKSGAYGQGLSSTAMTGLTNNCTFSFGSALGSLGMAQGSTATPLIPTPGIEYFDGDVIVPPGGVLGLFNITSNTTVSYTGCLVWEEVPV